MSEDQTPEVKQENEAENEGETVLTAEETEREITPKQSDDQLLEKEPAEVVETAEEEQEKRLEEDLEVTVDPEIVEKLSSGFLQTFLPTLEKSKSSLEEVLSNQKILIDTVEQENSKFQECQSMEELTQTMLKARKYYNKLITIKKEMSNLHDKSGKLKKRAVKLQQQRQKEELQKAQQREKEHEKERMLAARVAGRTDS
ncbi:biogenesis of lysosome-related organelles complex 1 subunit 6-like [Haliotis rubra]|uniref:biogenesis of lysosome-related organelles complex 1 subunit 6-like n=1 Tax=Haliotis rubra TaxID=36100 RepID=UPI001EE59E28|nr:biogenesis of lysosome-related organelles complex 1 subunit 6-like [Haliotis rubra]XP_046580771.1 biogenesis of lysosome-related organelles complex 1 subunit 6-like [Haliotis rubra]